MGDEIPPSSTEIFVAGVATGAFLMLVGLMCLVDWTVR